MSSPRLSCPRSIAVLLVSLALSVGALGYASPALAKHPSPPFRYGSSIEALAEYEPQTGCREHAKPGVAAFADLLLETYRSTGSLGIVRDCDQGGMSEHKEGRAFDWAMSAADDGDVDRVRDLSHWLLRTDRHGNRFAMARRLGIQYMIWNHRIWRAYDATDGWGPYTGPNPHTDHVHFSFSWRGARKNTSFWSAPGS